MPRCRYLSEHETVQVVTLLQESHTQRHVANIMNVSQSIISRTYNRYQETGAYHRRKEQGHHRITTPRDDEPLLVLRFMNEKLLRESLLINLLIGSNRFSNRFQHQL